MNSNNINLDQIAIKSSKTDFYSVDKYSEKYSVNSNNNDSMCLCYKFEDDKIHTLFNNNICRICGRNKLERSVKKNSEIPASNLRISAEKPIEKAGNNHKSNIMNDLNKKLSNNYMGNYNSKPSMGIKTENIKFISDKTLNAPNRYNQDKRIVTGGHNSNLSNLKIKNK